tara:strand:- start:1037 stop:1483 length:447 start_codon:yes stop_codon:yes gene_type:complete
MQSKFEYPSGYDVYWEKWVDVYQEQLEEQEAYLRELEDIQQELGISDEELGELDADLNMSSLQHIKTIMTPFGILPLTEQSLVSNHFKLWVGHCNFKLLQSHYQVIGAVEGVESVDIMTPYRFRVGIAKLFVDRKVMSAVKQSLVESL